MPVNSETCNADNLHNTKNTAAIVPRGNYTKETNNFYSIEKRNNSFAGIVQKLED